MVEAPKTPVRSICGREALGFSTEKVHGRHNFGGRSVKRMDSCVVCQIARHHSFRGPLRFQLISLDVRTPGVFNILTSKYASRHNGVHFFDISTSKSGSSMVCFVHFHFEMCFAPQRRTLFHLSSGQLAPHPPLLRAYFSTLRSHKSLERHSESRLSYLFAHLQLLSADSFSSLIFSLLIFSLLIFLFSLPLPCSAFHLSILSEA